MDTEGSGRVREFVLVSRLLLDIESLDERVAAVYLTMLDDVDAAWPLAPMAAAFEPLAPLPPAERERQIVALLDTNRTWYASAANLLKVWFCGQVADAGGNWVPGPPAAFVNALVWGMAGTQAQGLPGPFFGEWAYPPARDQSSVAPAWSES